MANRAGKTKHAWKMDLRPLVVDVEGAALLTTLSTFTIEQEERAGRFPRKRLLSARRTGYLVADIEAWAASRPASDLPPPPNTGHANRRGKSAQN